MNKVKKVGKRFGIILAGIILLALVVRTVLNIVFGIQLRNTIRQLKAQGRHITIDQIRPAPVPQSENGAVLLNQVFTLMTIGEGGEPYIPSQGLGNNNRVVSKIESVNSFSDISKWMPEERAEIPKLVDSPDMQKIYDLIEEASRRPKCNFNLKYEEGPAVRLPHLAKMRSVARLLAVKALIENQSGNLGGALDTLNTGLRISNLLKDEPVLISKLVINACDTVMIDCLQGVTKFKNIPQDKANLIINELSKHTDVNFLDGEMALFGGWVLRETNEGHAITIFNISESSSLTGEDEGTKNMGFFSHAFGKIGNWFWSALFKTEVWLWTSVCKKDLAVYFTFLSKLEDRIGEPYYKLVDEKTLPTEEWLNQIPKYCIFSRMSLPALGRIFEIKARHQAYLNVCRTGFALKVYKKERGYYPDFLDKLKPEIMPEIPLDTFTGQSLIYHKTTNSVLIYSVGENRKDDGGQWGKPSKWSDGYDIVWEE